MPDKAIQEKTSTIKSESAFENHQDMSYSAPVQRQPAEQQTPVETRMLEVYEGKVKLEYKHVEPGVDGVTREYSLQPEELTLQNGVTVTPSRLDAQVSVYGDQMDPASQGVVFTALGGRARLELSNFDQAKGTAELATMNIISSGTPDTSETEISAYLREPVTVELMTNLNIELGQGEYIRRKGDSNPILKFWQTRLTFKEKGVSNNFETELDENGLHLTKGQEVQVEEPEKELVKESEKGQAKESEKKLEDERKEGYHNALAVAKKLNEETPQQDEQVPETENKGEKTQEVLEDENTVVLEVFEPDDHTEGNFVLLKEIEFEEVQEVEDDNERMTGTAKFEFNKIPFHIRRPNGKEYSGYTQTKNISDTPMGFEYNDNGELYVEFDDPIELQVLPDGVKHLIFIISLEDAKITASKLTAGKIRVDVGVATKGQEEEDDDDDDDDDDNNDEDDESLLKKLFGTNASATVAMVDPSSELDAEGIHIIEGGKTLGTFDVSGFMDFLDVHGDYPKGWLRVTLQKKADAKASESNIFSQTAKDFMKEGLSIPIAGPLSFKLSVVPSVELNGKLSAELNRKKSFADEMKPGESVKLGGSMEVQGTGKLDMSAGLELGITALIVNLASADVKVETKLAASIGTTAQADTALGITEAGKGLQQTEDLVMTGEVHAGLSASAELSSNVKFLIWKAKLFTVELFNKEMTLTPYRGTATRDKDAHGLTNGWHFEQMGLTADAFGKKSVDKLRESAKAEKHAADLQMSKEAVQTLGDGVKEAWVILEQMKEQRTMSDGMYIMEDSERILLDQKIGRMTVKMQRKLEDYQEALQRFENKQSNECTNLQEKVKQAWDAQYQCLNENVVKQQLLLDTARGGLDWSKYRPLTAQDRPNLAPGKVEKELKEENKQRNQMAAIDVAIARVLGIRDNAVDRLKADYALFVQTENAVLAAKKLRGEEKNTPFYQTLDGMNEIQEELFFQKEIGTWGVSLDQLTAYTKLKGVRNKTNYYEILQEHIPITNGSEWRWSAGRDDFKVSRKFKDAFRVKAPGGGFEFQWMTKYKFMRMLLSGKYPEDCYDANGTPLGGKEAPAVTAEEKKAYYFNLFNDKLIQDEESTNDLNKWLGDKDSPINLTEREQAIKDINDTYKPALDSDIDTMVKKGHVSIEQKLEGLDQKLEDAKKEYLEKEKEYVQAIEVVGKIQQEKVDCEKKLQKLKENAKTALKMKSDAITRATDAVNFVEREGMDLTSGKAVYTVAAENLDKNSELVKELASKKQDLFQKSVNW